MRWYHFLTISIVYHIIVLGTFMYITPSFEELRLRSIKVPEPVPVIADPIAIEYIPVSESVPDAISPDEDPFEVEEVEILNPEIYFSFPESEKNTDDHISADYHKNTIIAENADTPVNFGNETEGNTIDSFVESNFSNSIQGSSENSHTGSSQLGDSEHAAVINNVPTLHDTTSEWKIYTKELSRHFKERKFYPDMARKLRLSGTVWITVVIRRDGSLKDVKIEKSSGYPILDQAALQSAKSAFPVPAFSDFSDLDVKTVQIPYHYQLNKE